MYVASIYMREFALRAVGLLGRGPHKAFQHEQVIKLEVATLNVDVFKSAQAFTEAMQNIQKEAMKHIRKGITEP
jgi:hypothetical protein